MADGNDSGGTGLRDALPTDQLGEEFQRLLSALVHRAVSSASDRVGGLGDKLESLTGSGGDGGGAGPVAKAGEKLAEGKSPTKAALSAGAEGLKDKVSNLFGGGKGGGKSGGKKLKVTNIIEQIDVGAPIDVVYNQWTQFQDFSNFMKKVEGVEQKDEQKLEFKAQVLWSHRTWEATIVDQVPDERIIWQSSGPKGHVDGAVTFHELAPQLTRVLVVLEYHPQGLFERTGNLWRAQGRRVRLELKHFRRHVMTETVLHPDDVEGWRGEIHDGDVVKSDEEGRQDDGPDEAEDSYDDGAGSEQDDADGAQDDADDAQDQYDDGSEDDSDDEAEDEAEDEEYEGPEDEYDEDDEPGEDEEEEDDEEDEGPTDEYDEDDDEYDEDDEDEGYDEEDSYDDEEFDDEADDEADDDEQPPPRRSRRPVGAGRR